MGVSRYPINRWFYMVNPIEMDDWGIPPISETSIILVGEEGFPEWILIIQNVLGSIIPYSIIINQPGF